MRGRLNDERQKRAGCFTAPRFIWKTLFDESYLFVKPAQGSFFTLVEYDFVLLEQIIAHAINIYIVSETHPLCIVTKLNAVKPVVLRHSVLTSQRSLSDVTEIPDRFDCYL